MIDKLILLISSNWFKWRLYIIMLTKQYSQHPIAKNMGYIKCEYITITSMNYLIEF